MKRVFWLLSEMLARLVSGEDLEYTQSTDKDHFSPQRTSHSHRKGA